MHCMLMDLLHGFEVLSTTEETLFNSRNVSRLVQNNLISISFQHAAARLLQNKKTTICFIFNEFTASTTITAL